MISFAVIPTAAVMDAAAGAKPAVAGTLDAGDLGNVAILVDDIAH